MNLTDTGIKEAQKKWADGIVEIGKAHLKKDTDQVNQLVNNFLTDLYDFEKGKTILFKPTKAYEKPFRITKAETKSYFIEGTVTSDKEGFALNPWREVEFIYDKNFHTKDVLDGIEVMGEYVFTDYDGESVKVQYTFVYKEVEGKAKIGLHHSSMPYVPRNELKLSLEMNGSLHAGARYIGWRPVKCTLHFNTVASNLVQGATVQISSESRGNGKIVFLKNPSDTIQQDTLDINVKDSKVDFYVAGKFGHPSEKDKDTSIIVKLTGIGVAGEDWNKQKATLEVPLMVRVRKNACNLNGSERLNLLKGLLRLTKEAPRKGYSKLGYTEKPNSLFDELVLMHTLDAAYEIHNRSSFYPWHRIFLLHLERELQEKDPTITLPYWKYDEKAPNLFTKDFIGETKKTEGAPYNIRETMMPKFCEETNPMFYWSTVWNPLTRAYYGTDPAKVANEHILQDECLLESSSNFNDWCVAGERKSHNRGHTAFTGRVVDVGKDPVDPLFFFLHTNVDRLWAKWQKKYNRFDAENTDTYPYQGKKETREQYNPGFKERQIGNCLEDSLWPWNWDNEFPRPIRQWKKGEEAEADGRVPYINIRLPQSEFFHSPIIPIVKDTIDFRGELDAKNNLGFDYDDIPYFDSDLNKQKKSERPCNTSKVKAESDKELIAIFLDASKEAEIRIGAINAVVKLDGAFLDACLSILKRVDDQKEVVLEAIHQLRASKRSSEYYISRRGTFLNLLRGLLSSKDDDIRAMVIEILSNEGDVFVEDYIQDQMKKGGKDQLSLSDGIFFLSFNPKTKHQQMFEEFLKESNDTEVQVAAAHALGGNYSSVNLLEKMLNNEENVPQVRIECAKSLHRLEFLEMNSKSLSIINDMAKENKQYVPELATVLLNFVRFTGDFGEVKLNEGFKDSLQTLAKMDKESIPRFSDDLESDNGNSSGVFSSLAEDFLN